MSKVLVAPNSFKSTASSVATAAAWARSLTAQGFTCDVCPVADGGDGTADVLAASGLDATTAAPVPVRGPLDGPSEWTPLVVRSPDGDDRFVFVESAAVCGMRRLPPGVDGGLDATTHGVGDALRAALQLDPAAIVVGIGGTASTDGGAGALEALGVAPGDSRPLPVPVSAWCDVDNPLLGADGAAAVYGPQKGLGADDLLVAEARLAAFASRWRDGAAAAAAPRSGAGGGLAFGLHVGVGADLADGFDRLAALLDLDARLAAADLVVTGEGRFDAQSLRGKATGALYARARRVGVPVVVVAGSVADDVADDVAHDTPGLAVLSLAERTPQRSAAAAFAAGAALVAAGVDDLRRRLPPGFAF